MDKKYISYFWDTNDEDLNDIVENIGEQYEIFKMFPIQTTLSEDTELYDEWYRIIFVRKN